ncbi:VOC family protein [Psychrobacter faecalis]|uniref:2-oxoadipate dioxygenase/decarboxylase n=1 Tax=Psychrobacter faecalis TaxID=180588 RepID=A0ABT9HD89_9GAMM|nr:VOC family protein [Psychrobacter faecalis]MDP4543724.1 VOC family protein [Psychrobacter faecalis]
MNPTFINSDDIRHDFSIAMSEMYQKEVPLYGDLIDLVSDVNTEVLNKQPEIRQQLEHTGVIDRLNMERHGAIRLGTAAELNMMRRLFAVMGMYPVGYYDLAPAGVPVHSTAFRAIDTQSLNKSPFRVFTSLLRLDLIDDEALKQEAIAALDKRTIFTDNVINLIKRFEAQGGLVAEDAKQFVKEALETFRWHDKTPVSKALYQQLLSQHGLIADVVGFKGPHINHLTPRTLDIDAVQAGMRAKGIPPKAIIEGPPRRRCPILLRQTSFKALEEAVSFKNPNGGYETGHHTARFGEIEQRGVALTPKGRALYDQLLSQARHQLAVTPNADNASEYYQVLESAFAAFPDDYQTLHDEGLAYFYYQAVGSDADIVVADIEQTLDSLEVESINDSISKQVVTDLLEQGMIRLEPIVYEDFLPVSAAGIFQSNLHDDSTNDSANGNENGENSGKQSKGEVHTNKEAFENALGAQVYDELELYQTLQAQSLKACLANLNSKALNGVI